MIFVFGSNEKGIHGGGAARYAREKEGAVLHQGFGPQGNSFAIPTCSKPTGEPGFEIPLERLHFYIQAFLLYAKLHPELEFKVTQVGCGLAGWSPEQVVSCFVQVYNELGTLVRLGVPQNCYFDTAWEHLLPPDAKFWGTA